MYQFCLILACTMHTKSKTFAIALRNKRIVTNSIVNSIHSNDAIKQLNARTNSLFEENYIFEAFLHTDEMIWELQSSERIHIYMVTADRRLVLLCAAINFSIFDSHEIEFHIRLVFTSFICLKLVVITTGRRTVTVTASQTENSSIFTYRICVVSVCVCLC